MKYNDHDHIKIFKISMLVSIDTKTLGPNCSPADFIRTVDWFQEQPATILSMGWEET